MTITRHTIDARMRVDPYWRNVSDTPVWSDSMQGALLWSPYDADTTTAKVLNTSTGRYELRVTWTSGTPFANTVYSGPLALTVGKRYRIVGHVYAPAASSLYVTMPILLDGTYLAGSQPVTLTDAPQEVWAVVQATSASAFATLAAPLSGSGTFYWTDVAIYEVEQTEYIELRPTRASVTLDSEWSPYVRVELTCPLPPSDALAKIDPRGVPLRATVTLSALTGDSWTASQLTAWLQGNAITTAAGWTAYLAGRTAAYLTDWFFDPYNPSSDPTTVTSRTFDVHLRTRRIDYVEGTMRLELAGDELYLQDFARYDTSTATWTPPATSSLRSLVSWALGLYGWSLEAGDDVTIDSTKVVWNLGESLWTFLDAFVRGNGKRLWCDELRRWWLTPAVPTAAGVTVITGPERFDDTLSRDDPAYGDAAVLAYEWVDGTGAQQRQYAFIATPGSLTPKTVVQRFTDQQPSSTTVAAEGVGALRMRAMSRGRAVEVRKVCDYSVTPGQQAAISTPVTTVSDALVSAVTWSLPEDVMDVRTRDVVA